MIDNTPVNQNPENDNASLNLEGYSCDFSFDFSFYLHYSNHL